jgi:protein ImuB
VTVRTLVAWCPDWPVVAAGHTPSEPVAVVHANKVVACSAAARFEGVHTGLRRREAQGRCPELLVLEQDLARDARSFEPVVAAVESLTPGVEVVRAGTVAFATRGPSRYFGGDGELAARVAAVVDETVGPCAASRGACRVGVADGPFAAELAARAESVTVVPRGTAAAFLAPFPIATLDRPDLVDLLLRLGIRTLGDLASLPVEDVAARFGAEGLAAHRLASGLDERPLSSRPVPPDLVVTVELEPPAEQVESAAFVAKAMADDLHDRLSSLGLSCTRIAIEAQTEHGEQLVRLWRHDGALSSVAIAERVRWQLDGWLSTGATTAGVCLLRLVPDEVKPAEGDQLGFWGGSAAADERASRGLARLQGLLGPDAVRTAVMGGGRDPAEQIRMVPWGDPREPARPGPAPGACPAPRSRRRPKRTMGPAADEAPPWPGRLPSPAPAIVHPSPLAAEVLDCEGCAVGVTARGLVTAPPAQVRVAGADWESVEAWAGPWPAEQRWWDSKSCSRRARFQLLLGGGAALLVALREGKWWVEAVYD